MSSTTQETHTMNTPQPYGGGELSGLGRSSSGVDASASAAPPTYGVGTAMATSKMNLTSGQNQGQTGNQGGRKDTNGVAEPAEEEGCAASGKGTNVAGGGSSPSKDAEPEGGYPEQLHAGKLDGPGPEYGKIHRVTLGDRIQGVKEELKGTVKRDPELKKTGKERLTGELKRKQQDADRNTDPFQNGGDDNDKKDEKEEEESDAKKHRAERTDEPGLTEHPQLHPADKGRQEQEASVHPEGSGSSDTQQQAKENAAGGQVP